MGGKSRLCHHAITKVFYGENDLVPKGGRINLTMRRVNAVVV
jgi:alkylated DNA repair protein (DNA oxidative demethylase)